jgi:hypothetical protein
MEAPQIVLPGEVHPVRNSSRYDSKPSGALDPAGIILECNPATGGTAEQQGIISNGVNIISIVRSTAHLAGPSEGMELLTAKFSQK